MQNTLTDRGYPVLSLDDTYLTELERFGCVAMLDDPATDIYYTRSYHNGHLKYGNYLLDAKFINFFSGNLKVLSIQGDGAQELYDRLLRQKKKRSFFLLLRKLIFYVYMLGSPSMGTLTLFLILSGNWKGVLMGCCYIMFLRFLYVFSRNHLR